MEYTSKILTIEELYEMITHGKIDLRPSYQRNFIWGKKDQQLLIDSILKGYPLPNFFIYKNDSESFEMVDGQQRAETICRFIKGAITSSDKRHFSNIPNQQDFWKYRLVIIEIKNIDTSKGEDIATFYALVNKQGNHLNTSEINKAQYANTPILTMIEGLINSEEMAQLDIFNSKTKSRMNDRALIEEIVAYLKSGFYDKRDAVDAMYESDFSDDEIGALQSTFMTILNRICLLDQISPINKTRYRQRNDFFTLFSFINTHSEQPFEILKYQYKILVWLDEQNIISPNNEDCELLFRYAINCVSQSNSKAARLKRLEILNTILCHSKKDDSAEYENFIRYLTKVKGTLSHKNVGDYYLIDIDDFKQSNGQ